jgi:hypothetical protein
VLEKVRVMREELGIRGFIPGLNFAAMTPDVAEGNIRLFAAEVLPVLQAWAADDMARPESRVAHTIS